jgi:hypothetical protein
VIGSSKLYASAIISWAPPLAPGGEKASLLASYGKKLLCFE